MHKCHVLDKDTIIRKPLLHKCTVSLLYSWHIVLSLKGFPINELWNKMWGLLIFTKIVTRSRFYKILKLIHFDDKTTRRRRLQGDRFALFSEFWFQFTHNSKQFFKPNAFLMINCFLQRSDVIFYSLCQIKQTNSPLNFGYWLIALQNISLMDFLILARMMSDPSMKYCQIM